MRGGHSHGSKSYARTVRIAPRKVRLVVDLIRGKQVGEAVAILKPYSKSGFPNRRKIIKLGYCKC